MMSICLYIDYTAIDRNSSDFLDLNVNYSPGVFSNFSGAFNQLGKMRAHPYVAGIIPTIDARITIEPRDAELRNKRIVSNL